MAKRIGGYTIQGELGQGGMGVTYRAWSERHQREVALKLCKPGLASVEECARLVREGRVLAGIDHPFVVAVLDSGEHLGVPYLVMELVEGQDLRQRLRGGPLEPSAAARLVQQVAEGVAQLHAVGVVHRDLKPENVLLDRRGSPRVCDLGLARGDELSRLTATGDVLGTPAFLAPEQAQGEPAGPPADVYSMGAMLFELVTGEPPFSGGLLEVLTAHVQSPAPRLRDRCPQAPRELEEVVARCLEKDPGDRYRDAAALARELGALGSAGASRTRRRAIPALALVALVGLVLGAIGWTTGESAFADALQRGDAALHRERLNEARQAYEEARRLDPESALPWVGLGRVAGREWRMREHVDCMSQALKRDPHARDALLALAVASAEDGDRERALSLAEACRAAHGEGPELAVVLSQLDALEGRHEVALSRVRSWTEAHPDDSEPWYYLGRLLAEREDLDEAVAAIRRACDLDPLRTSIYEGAWIALRDQRGDSLESVCAGTDEALARHPDSVVLACRLALFRYARQRGDLEGARGVLDRVIEREPRSLEPRLLRARILTEQGGALHVARADLDLVLDQAPRMFDAWAVRRELAVAQGDWHEACWAAGRNVELRPDNVRAKRGWVHCARVAGRQREFERAAQELWTGEQSVEAATWLAGQFLLNGRVDVAREWVDRGLGLSPSDPRLGRVELCVDAAQWGPRRDLAPVVDLLSRRDVRGLAAFALLTVATQTRNTELGVRARSALQADDLREPLVRLQLGYIALQESRHDVALGHFDYALSCQPDHPQAVAALAGLFAYHRGWAEATSLAQLAQRLAAQSRAAEPREAHEIVGEGHAGVVREDALFAEPALLLEGARAALEACELGRAHVLARALLAREPRNAEGWLILGQLAVRRDASALGHLALDRALAIEPDATPVIARKGRLLLMDSRDVEGARRQLERLEELDPSGFERRSLELSLRAAEGFGAQGRAELAEELLRAFPDQRRVMLDWATAVVSVDPTRAEDALRAYLEQNPRRPGWSMLAGFRLARGDQAGAEAAWRHVEVEGGGVRHRARAALARLAFGRRDYEGARVLVERALAEDYCLDAALWHRLGACLAEQGQADPARDAFVRAFSLASQPTGKLEALHALSMLAIERKDFNELQQWATLQVEIAPEAADGHTLLMDLALQKRRFEEACAHARRVLECPDASSRQREVAAGVLANHGQR